MVKAAHAIIDFIYLAQFQSHTTDQLHTNKGIFVQLGQRNHFNIPKIHSMIDYVEMIKSRGAGDGFNTETSEQLHINLAKNAFRATNQHDYSAQMTLWLQHQEAVQV